MTKQETIEKYIRHYNKMLSTQRSLYQLLDVDPSQLRLDTSNLDVVRITDTAPLLAALRAEANKVDAEVNEMANTLEMMARLTGIKQ